MKIVEDERGKSWGGFGAIEDIARRNKENIVLATDAQKKLATQLQIMVVAAHNCRVFPPNFRKTEICVKAENWRKSQQPEYGKLKVFCDANGITCRRTASGADIFEIKL